VATLVNPWSRLNWGITLGSFVYALTSTFLVIPTGFYIVQDLQMDGTALNVVSTMMVGQKEGGREGGREEGKESTFWGVSMRFYIVQDLQIDGTALNVVSTMMVGQKGGREGGREGGFGSV